MQCVVLHVMHCFNHTKVTASLVVYVIINNEDEKTKTTDVSVTLSLSNFLTSPPCPWHVAPSLFVSSEDVNVLVMS